MAPGTVATMMTHLLATDPATPGEALAWLARHSELAFDDALAIATHPNLPAGTPINVPTIIADVDLNEALGHPNLPTDQRATFIAAASSGALIDSIAYWDVFTTDELDTIHHDRLPAGAHHSFIANTHTSTALAAQCIATLRAAAAQSRPEVRMAAHLLADEASTRHGLPVSEHWAPNTGEMSRWRYLDLFIDQGQRTNPTVHQCEWWSAALGVTRDVALVKRGFTYAESAGWNSIERLTVHQAIALNTRLPPDIRDRSAVLAEMPSRYSTAPADSLQLTLGDLDVADAVAWRNPHVTKDNLRALLTLSSTARNYELEYLGAIAIHPASDHDLRQDAATQLRELGSQPAPDSLPAQLLRHHGAPLSALDVPYRYLTLDQFPQPSRHTSHWARAAWAAYARPVTTVAYAQALTTLDTDAFCGTLRELLATAAAITDTPTIPS